MRNISLFALILILNSISSFGQADSLRPISGKKYRLTNPFSPDPIMNYRWLNPSAEDELEIYSLRPVRWTVSNEKSFDLTKIAGDGELTIKGIGSIRFDFGQTNAGWLEFDSDDLIDSITMSISEYNEPAIVNEGAFHPFKTLSPVKHGNRYRLELNPELYEGVRFGWLNVCTYTRDWHIRNLRLVCQVKPVNYRGSFSCSDTMLNRIWYTGAYTVKLNFEKKYFGAILMERSDRISWTGDAHPAQAASIVAFGNYDFVKTNLLQTSLLNNDIASYSMYWILSLVDYVNYSGDIEIARKLLMNAVSKLDTAYSHIHKADNLGFYGWDERIGAGFENPDNTESQKAFRMLYVRTALAFARLMDQIGESEINKKYKTEAFQIFLEQRKDGNWLYNYGLHSSADAINTGLTTTQENTILFNRYFSDRVNRLSYSPFNEYFVISAMAAMNKYAEAVSAIKDMWGGQIDYGGTTFFEVFRPSWNNILSKNDAPVNNQCGYTSLTHPWSAGVVKWLSEEILGIKPLEPGFRKFEIKPHLQGNLRWVSGSTPTLSDSIHVDCNLITGLTSISIPKGTMAGKVNLPIGAGSLKDCYLNGKLVWASKSQSNTRKYVLNEGYLTCSNLGPGIYHYKLNYLKFVSPEPTKIEVWNYNIKTFSQDSVTHGAWNNRYGHDGYTLFNYHETGVHIQKLPSYVEKISLNRGGNIHFKNPVNNENVLNDTNGTTKYFGAITTQDPLATLQTMTIDIQVKDSIQHQLSIYLLDIDSLNRRSAVEIFDLKTLNLLSPVQMVTHYSEGKYLVIHYTGSIRIRVNQIRGKNASVSGLFFD